MGDDRPIRYVEAREGGGSRVVYRASSLGMCERAMLAAAKGLERKPHPQWFQDVLDEGTAAEEEILRLYQEQSGLEMWGEQAEVDVWIMDLDDDTDVVVRGHIDALAGESGATHRPRLVEAKKFRDSTWEKAKRVGVEAQANYPWQVAVYMHGLEVTECDFVCGHWQDGGVSEIVVHHLTNPPLPMKAIRVKIARVERLLHEGWDPSDAMGLEGGPTCNETTYPCAYWYLHQGAAPPVTPRISVGVTDELMEALAEYHRGKMMEAEGRKLVDANKKVLLAAMGDAKAVQLGDWDLTLTEYTVKEKVTKGYTAHRFTPTLREEA